jgi:hypothetical protein
VASVLLADAFANASGLRILKIDGVDTMVGRTQEILVDFLRMVKDDYDTVLLALASETQPPVYQRLKREQEHHETLEGPGTWQPLANWFWISGGQVTTAGEL